VHRYQPLFNPSLYAGPAKFRQAPLQKDIQSLAGDGLLRNDMHLIHGRLYTGDTEETKEC
jgi:hypothetical protein